MGRAALLPGIAAATVWLASPDASAAVPGKQGIEIEGPMDHRGIYVGVGAGGGVTLFDARDAVGFGRLDFAIGGGITERFTLGFDVQVMPYFTTPVGLGIGGDIEATGYVYRGLFLRGAVGALALPKAADDNDFAAGFGGRAGFGYEFFLNMTAALAFMLDYDIRVVPGRGLNHGVLAALRFTWF